jgi:hypothetical protein
MVDRDLVAGKLGELADHLSRVRARRPATADALAATAMLSTWSRST